MPPTDAAPTADIHALIARRSAGHSLPREFHTEAAIYRAEMERIFRRGWLFIGHACEIPRAGDYFLYEIDDDSIIVIRAADCRIHALYNTCRHRGSIICTQATGNVARLVCPYHQWSYGHDGELLSCGAMPDDFDKHTHALAHAAVEEVGGLLFLNLADTPSDFAPARQTLEPQLRPHGLNRAKVAFQIEYDVRANWKLVWENNRECLHCPVGHPQYVRANFDVASADDPRTARRIAARSAECSTRWRALGMNVDYGEAGLYPFPDGRWYRATRTPLAEGFVTESVDGQPAAPLMGDFREYDMGTLRLSTLPNFWNHSSSDHSVSTRLTPAGTALTKAQVTWLVHEDAVEGVDYHLDRLLPFWKLTSEQDWALCENNQRGVNSSRYQPGPYSTKKEYNVARFVEWYLNEMS